MGSPTMLKLILLIICGFPLLLFPSLLFLFLFFLQCFLFSLLFFFLFYLFSLFFFLYYFSISSSYLLFVFSTFFTSWSFEASRVLGVPGAPCCSACCRDLASLWTSKPLKRLFASGTF